MKWDLEGSGSSVVGGDPRLIATSVDHLVDTWQQPGPASAPASRVGSVLVRRETPSDVEAVRRVVAQAFAQDPRTGRPVTGEPVEVVLLDRLRADDSWRPPLSWVAVDGDEVVGHAVCTAAEVDGTAVVGLGPVGVAPHRQRAGVGSALVHALLGAADALEVPLMGLLGDPDFYRRFGFRPSTELGVLPPDPGWGRHFQARALSAHDEGVRGTFRYAQPFRDLEGSDEHAGGR